MKKKPSKNAFSTAIHDLYRKALQHTKYRWVVVFGTLLYLLSPLDISPDVFPVLGWIDDGIVVSLLVTEMSQLMMQQLKSKRETEQFQTEKFQTEQFWATQPLETDDDIPTITVEAVTVS